MQSQFTDLQLAGGERAGNRCANPSGPVWTESVLTSYFVNSFVPPPVEGWHPCEPLVATQESGENNSAILVPLKGVATKGFCFQYPAARLVGLPIS